MTATQHLAAILAADVLGYSRLMGVDKRGFCEARQNPRVASRWLPLSRGSKASAAVPECLAAAR